MRSPTSRRVRLRPSPNGIPRRPKNSLKRIRNFKKQTCRRFHLKGEPLARGGDGEVSKNPTVDLKKLTLLRATIRGRMIPVRRDAMRAALLCRNLALTHVEINLEDSLDFNWRAHQECGPESPLSHG